MYLNRERVEEQERMVCMKKIISLMLMIALALGLVCGLAMAEPAADTDAAAVAAEPAAEMALEDKESPFEDLLELPWYTVAVLIVLIAAGFILALASSKTKWDSRHIAMAAMCIAIGFVLNCIRLYRMPQGGSITPASMLPMVLFMVACGPLKGFVAGCAYGILQLITDPYIIHPIQMLLDYPLATGAMALCCLACFLPEENRFRLPAAVLLAGLGRYIMAVFSGSIFFAEYAGGNNAWIYSMVYNISYLGPDTLVCMIAAFIPGLERMVKMIQKRA